MNNQLLLDLIEENWNETVLLLQNLIKSCPHYENPEGIKRASSLIKEYLSNSLPKDNIKEIIYKNESIETHNLYVPVEQFGSIFSNDNSLEKRNLFAIIEGSKPGKTILLNGHYDVDCITVPEQWSETDGWKSANIKNNRIYGRGASDMFGGLCALLMITKIMDILKSDWNGKIITNAVCDEEIGGNGTLKSLLYLKEQGLAEEIGAALIAEPSDNLVCNESLGFFHFKVNATRPNLHMGVANKKNNSLYDIIKIIDNFPEIIKEICDEQNNNHTNSKKIKYNWGIINGGIDAAIPIGEVNLEGVIFLPENISYPSFKNQLIEKIRSILDGNTTISFSDFNFPGAISKESELETLLLNEDFFPKDHYVTSGIFPSPCDARLLKAFDIPVVIYGPGSLKQAHSVDEYIELDEIKQYTQHCLKVLWELLHD